MRDYELSLQGIIDACEKILKYTKDLSFDDFSKDDKTIDAVIRNFEIIGEVAKKVPNTVRTKHTDVDWLAIIGMRNIMIHDYFGVDLDEV